MDNNNKIKVEDIEKWKSKIAGIVDGIEPIDGKSTEILNNMKAYVVDSDFFLEKGDLVRSFEALIWAFAIYETCKELGLFVNRVLS